MLTDENDQRNIRPQKNTCLRLVTQHIQHDHDYIITMNSPNPLRLEPATLEDVDVLTELWYQAFTEPAMRHIWPDTPGVRKWWDEVARSDMLDRPYQRYMKIVEPDSRDAHGRPRIVAFAKWDLAMAEERGRRWPAWHEDQPRQECEEFLATLERNRRRVMGEGKHYCMVVFFFSFFFDSGLIMVLVLTGGRLGYAGYAP